MSTNNTSKTLTALATTIGFIDGRNYRVGGAKSHKPSIKKDASEEDKEIALLHAHVWSEMTDQCKRTGQPWSDDFPAWVMSWKCATDVLDIVSKNELARHRESFGENTPQGSLQWKPTPKFVAVSGHCRLLSAIEIMQEQGLDPNTLSIPIRVREFATVEEYYRFQYGDNEAARAGAKDTTALDRLHAAFRIHDCGVPANRKELMRQLPGTTDAEAIRMRCLLRLHDSIEGGIEARVFGPKPKNPKEFVEGGWFPIANLNSVDLNAIVNPLHDAKKEADRTEEGSHQWGVYAKLCEEIVPKIESFLEGHIDGSTKRKGVNTKAMWDSAFGPCKKNTLGKRLYLDHNSGGGFTPTMGRWGDLLRDPDALEAYNIGKKTLANGEAEVVEAFALENPTEG